MPRLEPGHSFQCHGQNIDDNQDTQQTIDGALAGRGPVAAFQQILESLFDGHGGGRGAA